MQLKFYRTYLIIILQLIFLNTANIFLSYYVYAISNHVKFVYITVNDVNVINVINLEIPQLLT